MAPQLTKELAMEALSNLYVQIEDQAGGGGAGSEEAKRWGRWQASAA
jgi:hypothetical protein